MRSKEYWEGRFVELQRSQLKRADSFAHELEDLHARMQKEIDDDITVWHKKVATANGISMADAKKLMSRKDRKEFQWTLEEYEQHAKADLLSGVTSAHVMNASANWHLSYLDGMKLQLEHHVDKLYKNIDSKTRNHFKESLNENYLNTAFELQKGIGIGEKMEVPYDERKLENILRTPWASDGKNFSQRIWKDRTQLVNNLQKNLSESVIRGDSDTDMIQALSKDEKKAEFNTRRLVETESAFFDSESERQCCEDFGIEKYRFLAVLDMKTSDICQELDNKVFLEKERQVGVNAPPMHPFCRSTTAPVVDEDFLTSRRAKNPKTGEYDEIPPEMNYKQWKEKYVEGKEPVEEVKQEQVQVPKETERGYKLEVPAKEVNTSEGETVYTNTAIPPKKKEEKGFDSEAYNNHVKEKANKQTVNYSEEEARINAEVERRVAEEREKIKKEFQEKQVVKLNKQANDILTRLEDLKNNPAVKDLAGIKEFLKSIENPNNKGVIEYEENNIFKIIKRLDKTCKIKTEYFDDEEKPLKKDCLKILPANPELCLGIYKQCSAIISRRQKSKSKTKEEIHMVDLKGGEIGIAEIEDEKLLDHKAIFTQDQDTVARDYRDRGEAYYVIHNHPDNSPPTLDDFNHIQKFGYTFGIVICHNGDIYKYRRTSITKYKESDWIKWKNEIDKDSEFTGDYEESWINIFEKYGLHIERIQ